MCTCLLAAFTRKQRPTPIYSFGFDRAETLAVFTVAILTLLHCLYVTKERLVWSLIQKKVLT